MCAGYMVITLRWRWVSLLMLSTLDKASYLLTGLVVQFKGWYPWGLVWVTSVRLCLSKNACVCVCVPCCVCVSLVVCVWSSCVRRHYSVPLFSVLSFCAGHRYPRCPIPPHFKISLLPQSLQMAQVPEFSFPFFLFLFKIGRAHV